MLKRFWSITIVTSAVLICSSTLVNAESRNNDLRILDQSNLELRSHRAARLPSIPLGPTSTSEPGDDDAPNKDGWDERPDFDGGNKGPGTIRTWSFKSMGTGIRLHLLRYFSALR